MRTKVNTPLQAKVWFHAISELNLNAKYPTLVESIRHGFNVGIPRIYHTFSPLPNGQQEGFNDDFIFPLQDLSLHSTRSAEDAEFSYTFRDIDRITLPLGYTWAADKDIPFCNEPTYFGFQWNLSERTVSIPTKKRLKYLNSIAEWEERKTHNAEHVAKLYGKLLHFAANSATRLR